VGDGVAAAGHSLGTQAAARQGSGSCGTDHEPANLLHPGTHRGQSDKPAGTHRHADVADAAVEQEGGEVRGCLAGCLCVHRHARRLPLGLRNLVAHVEGRGTQRVLRGGRTCVAGARAAAVSRGGRWAGVLAAAEAVPCMPQAVQVELLPTRSLNRANTTNSAPTLA
jgi:hypothetical protein